MTRRRDSLPNRRNRPLALPQRSLRARSAFLPQAAGLLILAALPPSTMGCTRKGAGLDAPRVPVSDVSSESTSVALFPNADERRKVEGALLGIWNALAPHGCGACHGAPGGDGWGKHQMPYWLLWKSQAVGTLGVLDTGVARVNPRDMKLFAILSGAFGVQMPPPRGPLKPTDTPLLESLSGSSGDALDRDLAAAGRTREDLASSLGTQLVYANMKGVCFDRRNTGAAPQDESLCEPFTALAQFATTWRGEPAKSIAAWNAVANKAHGSAHYDSNEGIVEEEKAVTLSDTDVIAAVERKGKETIYRLAGSNTVSFYVQGSPDAALMAFTETSSRAALAPRAFNLSDPGSPEGMRTFFSDGMRYDPIFSPDFDFATNKGFVVGAAGVTGSDDTKNFFFYVPKGKRLQAVSFANPVGDIAGYQTVARISDPSKVSPKWASLVGKYVIMGKRWRWFAIEAQADASGRTVGVRRVEPAGKGTNGPICASLSGEPADGKRDFDTADSMISPDGRWLSLRVGSGLRRTLAIVSTRDCKVAHVPRIDGKAISAGKASFSSDGRYVAFHAFGENGGQDDPMAFHNLNLIRTHADEGRVSNLFLYDTETGRTARVTSHSRSGESYVALFPMLDRSASRLFYHRHRKGARASEIVVLQDPLSSFP